MARSGLSSSGSGLQLSRRDLLRVLGVAGAGVAVASCGSDKGGGGGGAWGTSAYGGLRRYKPFSA